MIPKTKIEPIFKQIEVISNHNAAMILQIALSILPQIMDHVLSPKRTLHICRRFRFKRGVGSTQTAIFFLCLSDVF
jgi:hypothetical protein